MLWGAMRYLLTSSVAVLFLAKNTYVNGEILAVDGGVLNVVAGR